MPGVLPLTVEEIYERAVKLDTGSLEFTDVGLVGLTNLYLFCSFAYYVLNENFISDHTFDKLCHHLCNEWDFMAVEKVRGIDSLIVLHNLKAGTCLRVDYPQAVQDIARELVELHRSRNLLPAPQEESYEDI